ncbi:hypothetical protein EYE40_03300 [Glaciihabitans arcticus]|uniref:Uncharacterized protein n=1 Tax=Glaciihabitans arcticus TaxID=2668039 RepID=A0A4Q9GV64_9MICO|nr:hypothetical protein [Glaciihabitans arcticus]TBN56503.1 hypothetical protein EYE40_03300 [Glaciihabitans arcticus]
MKKLLVITLSLTLLTGCSVGAPEPVPTAEFVLPDLDNNGWGEATVDEFVDAFPDIDTSFVSDVPEAVYQVQDDSWIVGSGTTSNGFGPFDEWARANFEVSDDDDMREAIITTEDDRVISLSYRTMADGFIAYFFVGE